MNTNKDIDLENKSPVIETGRDALFSVDDLAISVAKLITSGEYLKEHQTTQKNKDALLKALSGHFPKFDVSLLFPIFSYFSFVFITLSLAR